MNESDKIVALLEKGSIEMRIAAAIVLGELRVKKAQDRLVALVESDVPVLQRHAIEALTKIGMPRKLAPRLFLLLSAPVADVREAARAAVTSFGAEIVPAIRDRVGHAHADERRVLDAILADLGGKDAFAALLGGLGSADPEASKEAAVAMRHHVKNADGRARKGYLAETERFLAEQSKAGAPPNVIAGAIKIIGYLEDQKATETLLAYAGNAAHPALVRQEAFIALRFALGRTIADKGEKSEKRGKGEKSDPEPNARRVVSALLDAAEAGDRTLATTALHTLGSMALPSGVGKRLEALALHPDFERARFVLEMLGRQEGPEATRVLVHAACNLERKRAEIAAVALGGREDAMAPLAKALLESKDVDRAWLLRNVLRPSAKKIPPAVRKQLLEAAMDRLGEGARGWEALLDVVRDADADSVAQAVRALAQKLRKAKNDDKAVAVYGLLCRTDRATDDDRYALASLELARAAKDTRAAVRNADDSLKLLSSLLARGFDVGGALRRDKSLDLDALYYVGFHFAEAKKALGEELLAEVVKKGGRTKVGKMAKNKLALLTHGQGDSGAVAEAD